MKKKFMASATCLALLLIMFLGSSLAWFTDSKANVNTMVAGKISIVQTETGENGEAFANNKYVMMPSQSVTKNVVVQNTGNHPCYVRSLFAFEDSADGKVLKMISTPGANIVIPGVTDPSQEKIQFTVTKGTKTTLFTVGYVHSQKLEVSGANSMFNPLQSVKLSEDADNSWQTQVDGYYELIVLSQASQTAGLGDAADGALDTAFGVIDSKNCVKWFKYVLENTTGYGNFAIAGYSAP